METIKKKKPDISRGEFNRRADSFLARIQKDLLPEHAHEILAINMETGEFVLGATAEEASEKFDKLWADVLMFKCRVDGGPVAKFHGK